ncbi:MAG: tyrosyl-tRNA synthetase [uncultured archaeon A07HN63]|nr:MAG: tyrosyl-tRNA synthetase [uncultured archaeon A07HN63]
MDTHELITRNAAEVVTESEVEALADDPEGKRAYVGYEPSGVLHLGHMLTATKLIELQEAGFEVTVLLADVHAYLNDKGTFAEIRETAETMKDQFIAYGLNEAQTTFVLGSEYQLDEEYTLDLHALELETTLSRAQRSMAEIQRGDHAKVSQMVYPLMQALDIEYLDVDLAVGGLDQRKVHMLARETLPELDYDVRPALHTPIIADLSSGRRQDGLKLRRDDLDGGHQGGYRDEDHRCLLPADSRSGARRRRQRPREPGVTVVPVSRLPPGRQCRRRAARGVWR